MHPLPWDHRTDQLSEGYSTIIYDANGKRPILDHLREDEALDIVRAVNAFEPLKDALEELLDYRGGADSPLEDEYVMERVQAALAKARGEQ
jgi:hypothetical protein